jgi:NADPH:quinone reductase-like Zn-dependent oxidoreductase
MTEPDSVSGAMRTVRFHEYGEPADVLRLETAPVPEPGRALDISQAGHARGKLLLLPAAD